VTFVYVSVRRDEGTGYIAVSKGVPHRPYANTTGFTAQIVHGSGSAPSRWIEDE
jgi:hypothetical protein